MPGEKQCPVRSVRPVMIQKTDSGRGCALREILKSLPEIGFRGFRIVDGKQVEKMIGNAVRAGNLIHPAGTEVLVNPGKLCVELCIADAETGSDHPGNPDIVGGIAIGGAGDKLRVFPPAGVPKVLFCLGIRCHQQPMVRDDGGQRFRDLLPGFAHVQDMVIAHVGDNADIALYDLLLGGFLQHGIDGHALNHQNIGPLAVSPPEYADLLADRGGTDAPDGNLPAFGIDDGSVRAGGLREYFIFCPEYGVQGTAGSGFAPDAVHVNDMEKGAAGRFILPVLQEKIQEIQDNSCEKKYHERSSFFVIIARAFEKIDKKLKNCARKMGKNRR